MKTGIMSIQELIYVLHTSVQCEEQIDPACCGVAVGSSSPGCAAASKGAGVHGLKGDVSWVEVKSVSL